MLQREAWPAARCRAARVSDGAATGDRSEALVGRLAVLPRLKQARSAELAGGCRGYRRTCILRGLPAAAKPWRLRAAFSTASLFSAASGGEFAFFSALPELPGFAGYAIHLPKAPSQCI